MTTLKPVTRSAHAVAAAGTRLAGAVEVLDDDVAHRRRALLEARDQRADGFVTQVGQELRFPVAECPFRKRGIEHAVERGVRDRAHHVEHRRTEGLDGPESRGALLSDPQWPPTIAASLAFESSGAV